MQETTITPTAKPSHSVRWVQAMLLGGTMCLALLAKAEAVEWTSVEFNCAIVFPDDLKETAPPRSSVKAFARSIDGSRFVTVSVMDQSEPRVERIEPRFVTEAKRGITEKGGVVTSERLFAVDGHAACELVGRLPLGEKTVSMKTLSVVADGRLYVIQAMSAGGNSAADSELTQCVGSFRFLRPPKAPDNSSLHRGSAAYRRGVWTGRLAPALLLALLVIYAIKRSRTKRQRPSQPPPLPPGIQ